MSSSGSLSLEVSFADIVISCLLSSLFLSTSRSSGAHCVVETIKRTKLQWSLKQLISNMALVSMVRGSWESRGNLRPAVSDVLLNTCTGVGPCGAVILNFTDRETKRSFG